MSLTSFFFEIDAGVDDVVGVGFDGEFYLFDDEAGVRLAILQSGVDCADDFRDVGGRAGGAADVKAGALGNVEEETSVVSEEDFATEDGQDEVFGVDDDVVVVEDNYVGLVEVFFGDFGVGDDGVVSDVFKHSPLAKVVEQFGL